MKTVRPIALLLALTLPLAGSAVADPLSNLFLLHHSTGRNIIEEGDVRAWIDDYNSAEGTTFAFWDHDYNYIGLTGPDGEKLYTSYDIPDDNTDPDGLLQLWTTSNDARDMILANHELIAFKSCYPASDIESDAELETRKAWYLAMRDVFDRYPEKVFVVLSQPPLHRLVTNDAAATRARAFADWLKSDAYLDGHDNLVCIDLFNELAEPDDGGDTANRLRYEYERSHTGTDSHPNTAANETVGPWFAARLIEAASALDAALTGADDVPVAALTLAAYPNPFNPRTALSFSLSDAGHVTLAIYDLKGARVDVLADRVFPAGDHVVAWDGRGADGAALPSGVYLARAITGREVQTRRMTLVR